MGNNTRPLYERMHKPDIDGRVIRNRSAKSNKQNKTRTKTTMRVKTNDVTKSMFVEKQQPSNYINTHKYDLKAISNKRGSPILAVIVTIIYNCESQLILII